MAAQHPAPEWMRPNEPPMAPGAVQEVLRYAPAPDHNGWWLGFMWGWGLGIIAALGVTITGLLKGWW